MKPLSENIYVTTADPPSRAAERDEIKECTNQYEKSEDDLKSLQSVGQIIGEVLKQLDEDRCESFSPSHTS